MSLDQFEKPAMKILNCSNTLPNVTNGNPIDRNLLNEYQKYILPGIQHLQFSKANAVESTEQVDIRVRKMEELEKRLKVVTSNLKIKSKDPNEKCAIHNSQSTGDLSDRYLDRFLAKEFVRTSIGDHVTRDAALIDEHLSNITKMKRFCDFILISELAYQQKDNNSILPGLQVASEVTALISKMETDIVTLTDATTLYSVPSKDAQVNPFEAEIKHLKNLL